jgi:nitroimidazol reductase NimA-like FMN-containing flavoprotein (pyridoxamine 5'-phosphate oxidase superfamily)
MRRNDHEIRDQNVILELLDRCHVGRMATNGCDGYPRIKPVNFVHLDGVICFHTALEGEKIGDIRRDSRVCFEVDLPIAHVMSGEKACGAGYLYRSVMIRGHASLIDDVAEKKRALDALMQKHEGTDTAYEYSEAALNETGIVCIDIEEMTGKESLGKGKVREAAWDALRTGAPLPVMINRDK